METHLKGGATKLNNEKLISAPAHLMFGLLSMFRFLFLPCSSPIWFPGANTHPAYELAVGIPIFLLLPKDSTSEPAKVALQTDFLTSKPHQVWHGSGFLVYHFLYGFWILTLEAGEDRQLLVMDGCCYGTIPRPWDLFIDDAIMRQLQSLKETMNSFVWRPYHKECVSSWSGFWIVACNWWAKMESWTKFYCSHCLHSNLKCVAENEEMKDRHTEKFVMSGVHGLLWRHTSLWCQL